MLRTFRYGREFVHDENFISWYKKKWFFYARSSICLVLKEKSKLKKSKNFLRIVWYLLECQDASVQRDWIPTLRVWLKYVHCTVYSVHLSKEVITIIYLFSKKNYFSKFNHPLQSVRFSPSASIRSLQLIRSNPAPNTICSNVLASPRPLTSISKIPTKQSIYAAQRKPKTQ